MHSLNQKQSRIVQALVEELSSIQWIEALSLGGSHARGRAKLHSDIDLGLYYYESNPFAISEIRNTCQKHNDLSEMVVSDSRNQKLHKTEDCWSSDAQAFVSPCILRTEMNKKLNYCRKNKKILKSQLY